MSIHQQVSVSCFGHIIQVDEGIAPLLQLLWKLNIHTYNSCQDNKDKIWIEIDLMDFENLVHKAKEINRELFDFLFYSDHQIMFTDEMFTDDSNVPSIVPSISWSVNFRFDKHLYDKFIDLLLITFSKNL